MTATPELHSDAADLIAALDPEAGERTYEVKTYGCQMNVRPSGVPAGHNPER